MSTRSSAAKRLLLVVSATAVALTLLVGPFALPLAQPSPSPQQQEGRKLFELNCTACHTIGEGVRVGPDLKGVTERRDRAWLKRFILEPDRVLREGDPIARAMLQEFGIPMPNLGLEEQQAEAVIAYLQMADAETPPVAVPSLYIPTLITGALVIVALTVIGLIAARKRVEVRT